MWENMGAKLVNLNIRKAAGTAKNAGVLHKKKTKKNALDFTLEHCQRLDFRLNL